MGKRPKYTEIDGLICPPTFVPEVLRSAMNYKPGNDEVVVATYPKCGTTWALQIVALILRKGYPPQTAGDYFSCMPFMEITTREQMSQMSKPGCIKTHLPFDRINFSKETKYIYVARHPADCVVSYYHHTRFFPIYFFTDGNFDDYFDIFLKGDVDYNDYFDHLLSWYEHRNEPNVLFLTFESMKSDHRAAVLKIARFLGEAYSKCLLDNDEEVLDKVLRYSSLDYMRTAVNGFWKETFIGAPPKEFQELNPVMKKYAILFEEATRKGHVCTGEFIRKGAVGEGKITLSKEQVDRLNERIREKTAHSDVMDLWKSN